MARVSSTRTDMAGFSYIELVVVIVLIGTLVAVALHELLPFVAQAERVAVGRMESQLRSALTLSAARRIARGESERIVELEGSNPMRLLLEHPSSYLGEMRAPNPMTVPKRTWYFDPGSAHLVYQAGSGFPPLAETAEPVRLEYAVRVSFEDGDGDGRFAPGPDTLLGVRLIRVRGPEQRIFAASP